MTVAHCTVRFTEVPQAKSGKQETSRPLQYARNSTGSDPGCVLELAGKWASVELPGNHPWGGPQLSSSWQHLQNLLQSICRGYHLSLRERSAPGCLSSGQVRKEQQVKEVLHEPARKAPFLPKCPSSTLYQQSLTSSMGLAEGKCLQDLVPV